MAVEIGGIAVSSWVIPQVPQPVPAVVLVFKAGVATLDE